MQGRKGVDPLDRRGIGRAQTSQMIGHREEAAGSGQVDDLDRKGQKGGQVNEAEAGAEQEDGPAAPRCDGVRGGRVSRRHDAS